MTKSPTSGISSSISWIRRWIIADQPVDGFTNHRRLSGVEQVLFEDVDEHSAEVDDIVVAVPGDGGVKTVISNGLSSGSQACCG